MRLVKCGAAVILLVNAAYAGTIDLTQRSILVGHIGFPTSNTIEQFDITGVHSNSLLLGFSGLAESVTLLDGNILVSDSGGTVRQINSSSGTVESSFDTGHSGLNGLGTYGSNLLTLSWNSSQVYLYSPAGVLQTTITLASTPSGYDWNGITSDGTSLFLADYASGRIYNYSTGGSQLGSFDTGLRGLSGVAYDTTTSSLWVANAEYGDTATQGIYQFSVTGTSLGSYLTPTIAPNAGIALTGGVPEPSTLLLFVSGCVVLGRFFVSRTSRKG